MSKNSHDEEPKSSNGSSGAELFVDASDASVQLLNATSIIHRSADYDKSIGRKSGDTLGDGRRVLDDVEKYETLKDRSSVKYSRFACDARLHSAARAASDLWSHQQAAMPPTPSVVDPLLSLLHNVRKLDTQIWETLLELGVDPAKVPHSLQPINGHRPNGRGFGGQRVSLADMSSISRPSGAAASCSSPILRYFSSDSEALEVQLRTMFASSLSAAPPVLQDGDSGDPTTPKVDENCRNLASIVASVLSQRDRPVASVLDNPPWYAVNADGSSPDCSGDDDDKSSRKRARYEGRPELSDSGRCGVEDTEGFVIDIPEPQGFCRFLKHVAHGLKKLAKTEKRAIEALTTNNIAKTFAPHAKEDDESASAEQGGSRRGSQKGKFDPPGVAAVFDDYRRLIDHKDQMSQAQFRVWTLVQEAKDSFDHFVEAARAVAPCEHYLWSHCDELCVEHDAVLELRAICLRLRDDLMRLA